MRAIVTAGGTQEPIDDVRVITNLSSGRLGVALARALAARGAAVKLLAGPVVPTENTSGVEVVRFGTAAQLDEQITRALAAGPVRLFLMAAAVSDWAPIRKPGKLASHGEEMVLHLAPRPKILPTLRERCGGRTLIVGFKLLSRVTDEALIHAAQQQIREARTDFCVANDLQRIDDWVHPVHVVGRDGSVTAHEGSKSEVAEAIVERVWSTA